MEIYLNASAANGIFGKDLDRFGQLGIRGCRGGYYNLVDTRRNLEELARWVRNRPFSKHIYLIEPRDPSQIMIYALEIAMRAKELAIAGHVAIEPVNEPNIERPGDPNHWHEKPADLGRLTEAIWNQIKGTGVTLLSPAVGNVKASDLIYAETMLAEMSPEIPFAFHRYVRVDLTKPQKGFASRQDEMEELLRVAAGRDMWVTETGQSETYDIRRPWPRCFWTERRHHSEDEVARQIVEDIRFWYSTEVIKAVVYYQLNDRLTDEPENRYGWRHFEEPHDGPWKLVAQLMPAEIAKIDPDTKPNVQPSRQAQAKARWLHEPEKPKRNIIPLGNSLFYALGTGMPREHYSQVIDNFAGVIGEARFNMSTLGWGDEGPETQTAPPVIPFLKGNDPGYWGYSRRINPAFLDEMEWRLDYAVNRGVRPQLTVFWGAFQEMFIKSVNEPTNNHNVAFHEEAMEDYLRAICERLEDHPAVNIELFNEINHGAHLWMVGRKGRRDFIRKWGRFIKERLPDHLLTVSGENVANDGKEGGYHFAYHDVAVLDYWNVHFDRSKKPAVEGFEPWVRSVWHLNEEAHRFRAQNPGQGYGRNDEPMFLQTQKQHQEWPYRWSTLDWKMYGVSIFVALCAGVATTIHNQGGFFHGYRKKNNPDPNFPLTEPIYKVARFYQKILDGFNLAGCTPYNSGWSGSPVRDMGNSFKGFSLVGKDKESILITVLNPSGQLKLDLDSAYIVKVCEITGEEVYRDQLPAGPRSMPLPMMPKFEKCAVIRLDRWKP